MALSAAPLPILTWCRLFTRPHGWWLLMTHLTTLEDAHACIYVHTDLSLFLSLTQLLPFIIICKHVNIYTYSKERERERTSPVFVECSTYKISYHLWRLCSWFLEQRNSGSSHLPREVPWAWLSTKR